MARRINGKPSLVASLTSSIKATLESAVGAADRIMAGTPAPGDAALLRAGEKSIEFLFGKVAS